jgi:hypothetical protein
MPRLRWSDSTNSVSEDPGTLQPKYRRSPRGPAFNNPYHRFSPFQGSSQPLVAAECRKLPVTWTNLFAELSVDIRVDGPYV